GDDAADALGRQAAAPVGGVAGLGARPLAGAGLGDWSGGPGGLAEGGSEEVDAFWPRRARKSRTSPSRESARCCKAPMRASRSRRPGQRRLAREASEAGDRFAAAPVPVVGMDGDRPRRTPQPLLHGSVVALPLE